MKLILQIAIGVFLGTSGSRFIIDSWHAHQEKEAKQVVEQLRFEQQKARLEQGQRVRAFLMQGHQDRSSGGAKAPPGFIPDDAAQP